MIATATSDAARFVAGFADGWSGPYPERLLDLLHPDVRLLQPLFAPTTGRAAVADAFFRPLLRFLPDLRLAVDRWAVTGDVIFIEWTATATLGGRPLRWPGIDRFVMVDGRATERVAYFDALPLFVAILRRPSSWPAFARSGLARSWRRLFAGPSA